MKILRAKVKKKDEKRRAEAILKKMITLSTLSSARRENLHIIKK